MVASQSDAKSGANSRSRQIHMAVLSIFNFSKDGLKPKFVYNSKMYFAKIEGVVILVAVNKGL